ncbi:MAG: 30S ribosomal protein S7 [Candidatus Marinimicrobia bacterium]|nr:30S ribosomal protein S7 [Candidatus Neomarinimicrobiota bacterium]
MPRRKKVKERDIEPDPIYGDKKVAKFINYIMRRGKMSVAQKIFYTAMDIIEMKTGQKGIEVFRKAIQNVQPVMEVKSRRIGGATYQVPVEVPEKRRFFLASKWLISFAKARKGKPMAEKLAEELIAASKGEGSAIKKRDDTHRMAEANKAFAHFR